MPENTFPIDSSIDLRPELISRRGEIVAWTVAALTAGAWGFLAALGFPVHPALKVLAILLALCGAMISLGNWMDRQTRLQLTLQGIEFTNGLRHVRLRWGEIQRLEIFPSPWGDKVSVQGTRSYFSFRTLGEVKAQGKIQGRMGFVRGDEIKRQILEKASLKQVNQPGSGYYYSRE
jgi:hypothetical protein